MLPQSYLEEITAVLGKMPWDAGDVTVLCRAAADKLDSESNRDTPILFPGWDDENASEDERRQCDAIRRVAEAIISRDDPDHGSTVTCGELALLVHYIADMLEE
jgi:hypothetical protein